MGRRCLEGGVLGMRDTRLHQPAAGSGAGQLPAALSRGKHRRTASQVSVQHVVLVQVLHRRRNLLPRSMGVHMCEVTGGLATQRTVAGDRRLLGSHAGLGAPASTY